MGITTPSVLKRACELNITRRLGETGAERRVREMRSAYRIRIEKSRGKR